MKYYQDKSSVSIMHPFILELDTNNDNKLKLGKCSAKF